MAHRLARNMQREGGGATIVLQLLILVYFLRRLPPELNQASDAIMQDFSSGFLRLNQGIQRTQNVLSMDTFIFYILSSTYVYITIATKTHGLIGDIPQPVCLTVSIDLLEFLCYPQNSLGTHLGAKVPVERCWGAALGRGKVVLLHLKSTCCMFWKSYNIRDTLLLLLIGCHLGMRPCHC